MHPILLRLGETSLSSYGVLSLLGWAAGLAWLFWRIPGRLLPRRESLALAACLTAGALIGGKLFFFIVERRAFASAPEVFISNWRMGWVFWGGVLGAIACVWAFLQARRRAFPPIADELGAALPMGHWLGRMGCFLEGCCHGRPSGAPWAVRYGNPAASVPDGLLGVPLHPVQLYEAAGALALCLFIVFGVLPRIRAGRLRPGAAFLTCLCGYAAMRFVLEFYRGDDRGSFLWPVLSPGQWTSLGVLLACGIWLWRRGIIAPEENGQTPRDANT
ncbi:MAG: prolipoprotein diacylglyceryl transferase [Elusimicrobia bacterium]|nr:prolipoprotein diacylglyceryl transferase [Elusimicrobiota bacterium]